MFDDKALNIEEHEFYLLNRDIKIAKFKVKIIGTLEKIEIIEVYCSLPEWLNDLPSFIKSRRAPKKREHIEQLLKQSGCDTIYGYLSITHALSLIDTFWVKPIASDLIWDKVSLYTHKFNEVVAKTAFEGGLHGHNLSTTSPEYGTDGTFAKCWIREDGQIKLLKRGSTGARNAGLEPYSEFYISQIAEALNLKSVIYDLRNQNNRICSICDIFTSEQFGYLPFSAISSGNTSVLDVVEIMSKYGLEQQVRDMFVFDAIVFNEDRHKGNFGFIIDNETQEIVDMAPLFDHNIALLCYAEQEDFDDLDLYLEHKGPRLGEDFVKDASVLLTPTMRKKLISLKGFEFKRHPKYNLPGWRLDALNKAVHRQIELILE